MDKLEKFFAENRESFDDAEPVEGHFSRFQEKLDMEPGSERFAKNRMFLLKIAAVIIVLLTVSVFVFDFTAGRLTKAFKGEQAGAAISTEMQEAINYYDKSASSKLGQIDQLACCGQDTRKIHTMAGKEMNDLDANSAELQKALSENPGNERIQNAIIRNHQMKDEVMKQVVKQMKRK
ncbi:MAG: hypothetical protein NTU98_04210 [Bacteroidetes bacterium]|nr:hypothetical protein [Bacteroidota bacterium]